MYICDLYNYVCCVHIDQELHMYLHHEADRSQLESKNPAVVLELADVYVTQEYNFLGGGGGGYVRILTTCMCVPFLS